jgi:Ca2+-binding RTX toxin-like protein
MLGGAGNDVYYVDNAGDVITEAVDGGWDKIVTPFAFNLAGTNLEGVELIGTTAINAHGTDTHNDLIGNAAANILYGYGGNDDLTGNGGNDTLIGGTGDDWYDVSDTGDTLIENAGEGTDQVMLYQFWLSGGSYVMPANVEDLSLSTLTAPGSGSSYYIYSNTVGAIITGNSLNNAIYGNSAADKLSGGAGDDKVVGFAGNDTLEGGAGNDWLNGDEGNDTIDGGAGSDSMFGGQGNDTYMVDSLADYVSEYAGSTGTDTVIASTDFTLGSGLENLVLSGSTAVSGTGNEASNELTGNSAANILIGGAGHDALNGGLGNDTMTGGIGDDYYYVDTINDVIVENAGEGTDGVVSSMSYVLAANLEVLSLTGNLAINGTGNDVDNSLYGNNAANVLTGGAGTDYLSGALGSDTLVGGTGDDSYFVQDALAAVTELAGEGVDNVTSTVSFTLGANVETLRLNAGYTINGTGNELANTIWGNALANTLDGGQGADTLQGYAGDDVYVVNEAGDVVVEAAGEGADLVRAHFSYVLGNNVENLALMGTGADSGHGNALNNTLTGNTAANLLSGAAGNDFLDGGAGTDVLEGGTGDDTYVVDTIADVVTESAGEGLDQVRSAATLTLGSNVEVLALTGSAAIDGTGNADNNLLSGNGAANRLDGLAGNDILQGGAGNDTLSDLDGNNVLDGGDGIDVLSAGAGNDFLAGGLGADTLNTGTGADVIAFNRGDGADIVNASTVKDNTISLGKGIRYSDLLFKKNLNDLILVTGTNEQLTFKDWYASPNNRSIANLQIVIEGTLDYNAGSTNVINHKKVAILQPSGATWPTSTPRPATCRASRWCLRRSC